MADNSNQYACTFKAGASKVSVSSMHSSGEKTQPMIKSHLSADPGTLASWKMAVNMQSLQHFTIVYRIIGYIVTKITVYEWRIYCACLLFHQASSS